MNTSVTSKEAILETCRQLVSEKGLSSLNIRAVANACKVATGSLYYYFPSKDDLLLATIESVWEHIFRIKDSDTLNLPFPEYINQCFQCIQSGARKYPNFFTMHSISFASTGQTKAHESMEHYLGQIKEGMLTSLHTDEHVNKNAFHTEFTEADFVDFVLSNVLSLLVQQQNDCHVLLEIIHRTIYFC